MRVPWSRSRIVGGTAWTIAVLALSPATAAGADAPAAPKPRPRLYVEVVPRGQDFARVFKVRPPSVTVGCANGGVLALAWRHWTSRFASGSGRTQPCVGDVQPVSVYVSRPVDGYFTRLSVRYDGGAPNRLGLGHVGGRLAWLTLTRLADRGSGAAPWPR